MELNLDWQARQSAVWPEVRYEIRPLRVWAFQALLAFWEAHAPPPEEGPAAPRPSAARSAGLMEVAARIFPDHVRAISGLTLRRDGRTEPATPEALCEEAALLPLAGEVIAGLIALSEVSGAAEKN